MPQDPEKVVSGVIYAFSLAGDVADALRDNPLKTCTDRDYIGKKCGVLAGKFEQHARKAGQVPTFNYKDSNEIASKIERAFRVCSVPERVEFLESKIKPQIERLMPAWQLKIAALVCRLSYAEEAPKP